MEFIYGLILGLISGGGVMYFVGRKHGGLYDRVKNVAKKIDEDIHGV